MDSTKRKLYWNQLIKSPLFWIGAAMIAAYFFVDSFLMATLGLVLLIAGKYRVLNKIKD